MILLIRYGEIHLKGLNRPHFEMLQRKAIVRALREFPDAKVYKGQGRFYAGGISDADMPRAVAKAARVFGLHSVSPAIVVEKDADAIGDALIGLIKEQMAKKGISKATFKVEAKRADKRFPMGSMELNAYLGGYILDRVPGLSVDVHSPMITLYVEVRDECCVYTEKIPAAGGMPQKSNGRAMLLLSGGIDSPVAGYMIAKRGVELNAAHFFSFPYTSEAAKQKVLDLAGIVGGYAGRIFVHMVPFTDIQTLIHEKCPPEMMVLIMRRFMMRIAERLAVQNECGALVTGESLGQVASQTMESLIVTNSVVGMPVFRPLIGMDKSEIIEISKDIGAYETSILPHEDCCTVFVPKHPLTRPKTDRIAAAESALAVEALVEEAVSKVERIVV